MDTKVDFDALAKKAVASDGLIDDLNNLFGETLALEKWLFIARGSGRQINPYIAANAGYAGGKPMIRVFTDTGRLIRFAQENNLTEPDGSTQMLETPTASVIEYLEGFIADDVHAVWFNSDKNSEGYYIPIVKLKAIKEHLAKTGWKSTAEKNNAVQPSSQNATPAPPPPKSEDYGLSQTPDGKPDVRIRILKTGNVKLGTSLMPFYSAFAPLLKDYQGSGEFGKLMNFAAESMVNLKQSVMANAHGDCIRLRTFQYHKTGAMADAMTIDSNQLRHITTGATLLISFVLLNMASPASAALYFSFEAGKSEIQKLLHSIETELKNATFIESEAK